MKKKTWKRCVCMIGVVLFAVTGLNANNRVPDSPIKKTRSNTFIIEKEKAWEPAGEGVARQIMGYDGQVMLVKVKFEKGAIGTPHTHYHTQTTYVVSGKFEFTVGDEKKIVEAGIIRKTKRFAIPERAVYFLKTKRTAGGSPPPQNIFDRLTPVFT